jgi:hypothetical protein
MADNTSDKNFLDLKIRVSPQREEGYPVEITLGGQQEFRGILAANVLLWVPSSDLATDVHCTAPSPRHGQDGCCLSGV